MPRHHTTQSKPPRLSTMLIVITARALDRTAELVQRMLPRCRALLIHHSICPRCRYQLHLAALSDRHEVEEAMHLEVLPTSRVGAFRHEVLRRRHMAIEVVTLVEAVVAMDLHQERWVGLVVDRRLHQIMVRGAQQGTCQAHMTLPRNYQQTLLNAE